MLVVIAIIATLAAILFPVFAQAREKARQITCASNEDQIGLAVLQHVQDYDEYYPQASTFDGKNDGGSEGYTYEYWPGVLYPYIKSAGVFSCPDDPRANDIAASLVNDRTGGFFGLTSYGMNVEMQSYNKGVHTGLLLSQINYPAELCIIAEDNMLPVKGESYGSWFAGFSEGEDGNQLGGYAPAYYSASTLTPVNDDPPNYPTNFTTPIARHQGRCNVLFADGHVKALTFDAIYNQPAGTTLANFKLWHPDAQ